MSAPIDRTLRAPKLKHEQNYLEDSTAVLVRSIQPLVNTVRTGGASTQSEDAIVGYIRDISATVQDIATKTNEAVYELQNAALQRHTPPVVKVLESSAAELVRLSGENNAREALPPIAFRIARATKVCPWLSKKLKIRMSY